MRDDQVPTFWQRLGLPGLVDVHVHFLPPRMLRKVWEYFDAAGPLVGVEWPIIYKWPDEDRVAHLAAMGVRAYPALAYAHRPGMAAELNDWTLDFADAHPACVPTATFFPEPGAPAYVDRALDRGARLFKVHLQVGGYDPTDPLLEPVWGRLAEAGVAMIVHAGSGPVANGYTGPEPFGAVLARHPRLAAVIAHMGAPEYEGFFALADRYPSVSLDTTMVFTEFFELLRPFPKQLLPQLRDLGLAGRIMLGSDFPNLPYEYVHQLEGLAGLDLGDDWLRAVCWTNGARMLQISP